MKQLIYCSNPFGFDRAMLAGILMDARRNNTRDDVTGALLCRHDLYLQLIEGSAPAIDALYARILHDNRHSDVRLLLSDTVETRMFRDWSTLDDEMPSMAWSPAEVEAGAIEAAPASALCAIFGRVAAIARERAAPAL